MNNIVIIGGPKTGKTTMANATANATIRHTDDLIATTDWSELSEIVSTWFDEPGPWVIEGVATARAIRKWLARNDGKFPATIVWLSKPKQELVRGQESMRKGVEKVFNEIRPELEKRGVLVVNGDDQRTARPNPKVSREAVGQSVRKRGE